MELYTLLKLTSEGHNFGNLVITMMLHFAFDIGPNSAHHTHASNTEQHSHGSKQLIM